jgi:hypothetical protein
LESFAHANNCVTLKRNLDLEEHSAHQDMSEISSTQRTLEKAISALTVDVSHRFEDMLMKQRDINESLGVLNTKESNGNLLNEMMSDKGVTREGNGGTGGGTGGGGGSPMVHKAIEKMHSRNLGLSRGNSRVIVDRSDSNHSNHGGGNGSPSSNAKPGGNSGTSSSSSQRSARIKQEIKRRKSVVSSSKKNDQRSLSSQYSLPLSGSSTNSSSSDLLHLHSDHLSPPHSNPVTRTSSQVSSCDSSPTRVGQTITHNDSLLALNAIVTDEDVTAVVMAASSSAADITSGNPSTSSC